jgi:hydroxyacylglutathione hydrolase
VHVEVIPTEELGDRSYLVHDGTSAVVVDPQRDIDRVEKMLADLGVRCAVVVETHIHNDYVTGGYDLSMRNGCPYVVNAADDVSFARLAVSDGDELAAGAMTIRVVATPGHTDTHLSYVISQGDQSPAVFTGGSLLYGSVGRTDLVDVDRTEELTRAQYHSARRTAAELPDATPVYPTHGFGSFCSSGSASGGDGSTIGEEKRRNVALITEDEDAFVDTLIANLTAYPAYYAHMGGLNRGGPTAPDLSPPARLQAEQLRRRIDAGEWVVDLRDRTAYASSHVHGSVGIALGQQFSADVDRRVRRAGRRRPADPDPDRHRRTAGQRHRIQPGAERGRTHVVLPAAHVRRATGCPCGRRNRDRRRCRAARRPPRRRTRHRLHPRGSTRSRA